MLLSFSRLVTTVLSVISIASAVNVDKESCTRTNPWAPRTKAGAEWGNNPDSEYFCEAGYIDGNVLTGIRIWGGEWAVWGMSFQWGELEWGKVYGTNNGDDWKTPRAPHKEVTWQNGDQVSIRMKNNNGKGGNDAVGWIEITIKSGDKQTVESVGSNHAATEWVDIDSGAKKIVALQGKGVQVHGTKREDNFPLRTLEFFFLESNVHDSSMTEIKFAEDINAWNSMKKGIELGAAMGEAWYVNRNLKGGLNQTFSNTLGVDISHSQSFSTTRAKGGGFGIGSESTIEAKIPFMAGGKSTIKADAKFEYTKSDLEGREESRSYRLSFMQGAQFSTGIPPQSATNCTVTATVGKFDSDYTATITVTLENGQKFAFYERGKATTINHVGAVSSCQTIPLADMPQVGVGTTVEEGKDVQQKKRSDEGVAEPISRRLKRAIRFFA